MGCNRTAQKTLVKNCDCAFCVFMVVCLGSYFLHYERRDNRFLFFYGFLRTTFVICWLLTILGYSRILLNKTNKLLAYASDAVYPFYILHQTIMMIFGYYIIQLPLGIIPKFVIVAIITFGGSFILYEIFIKRFNVTRVLFGMKSVNKNKELKTESVVQNE